MKRVGGVRGEGASCLVYYKAMANINPPNLTNNTTKFENLTLIEKENETFLINV